MRPVFILDRDICSGYADLTIVPCSGKMKEVEKPRNQQRIETYGLPTPHDLRMHFGYGRISPIISPKKNVGRIKYFAFAASVLNKSDPSAIQRIGEQMGRITRLHDDIRLVEAPFLGCGDGQLSPVVAIPALAKGFLSTHHSDATLQLCSDSHLSVTVAVAALGMSRFLLKIAQQALSVAEPMRPVRAVQGWS